MPWPIGVIAFHGALLVWSGLLRNVDAASLLICIGFSAPLGMLLAELIRRRAARGAASPGQARALSAAITR